MLTPQLIVSYSYSSNAGLYAAGYDVTDYGLSIQNYNRVLNLKYLDDSVFRGGRLGKHEYRKQWPLQRREKFKAELIVTDLTTGESTTVEKTIDFDPPVEGQEIRYAVLEDAANGFTLTKVEGGYQVADKIIYPIVGLEKDQFRRFAFFRRRPTDVGKINTESAYKLIRVAEFGEGEVGVAWYNEAYVEVDLVFVSKVTGEDLRESFGANVVPAGSILADYYNGMGSFTGTTADPLENEDAAPNYDALTPPADSGVLTNLAAMKAKLNYPLPGDAFRLALQNAGLKPELAYSASSAMAVDVAIAELILTVALSPKLVSDLDYSISTQDLAGLLQLRSLILKRYNLPDELAYTGPVIQAASWGSDD